MSPDEIMNADLKDIDAFLSTMRTLEHDQVKAILQVLVRVTYHNARMSQMLMNRGGNG